jgi:superfamily II DNA helicase RecQ
MKSIASSHDTGPFKATNVDVGCSCCGKLVSAVAAEATLYNHLRSHKTKSPACFADIPKQNFKSVANSLIKDMEENNRLFLSANMGDADHFFRRTDPASTHRCLGCNSLHYTRALAKKHTHNVEKCAGKEVCPVLCRETIFGTLVRVPAAKRQRLLSDSTITIRPIPLVSPLREGSHAVEESSDSASVESSAESTTISTMSIGYFPFPSRPSAPDRLRAALRAGFRPPSRTEREVGEDMIKPFLEPDDDASAYAVFYDYLGRPPDVEKRLRSILQYTSTNSSYMHEVLVEAANQLIDRHLRHKVECIWPNIRAILQSIGPQEDADEKLDNGTFTFRKKTESLKSVAVPLVLFLWNNPDWLWEEGRAVVAIAAAEYPNSKADAAALVIESGVLADAFLGLLVQEPREVCEASVITVFAASQCFKYIKKNDSFRLRRPDTSGRTVASIHHLLRAGACCVLCHLDFRTNVSREAREFALGVKVAKPNSVLCGMIRSLKERFERSTISTPPSTFDDWGNLCVGNEVFLKEIIDNLIPNVLDIAKSAIEGICGDKDRWQDVLDLKNTIEVKCRDKSKFEFSIVYPDGEKRHCSDLVGCVEMTDCGVMEHVDVLIGCCCAALQGFGCGAPRGTEYSTVKRSDVIHSGGKMFYETVSNKQKSEHVKTRHCLPPCMSRVFILAICMLPPGDGLALFHKDPESIIEIVNNVWGRVYKIPRPVLTSDMRQLFAAIANSMNRVNPSLNLEDPGKVSCTKELDVAPHFPLFFSARNAYIHFFFCQIVASEAESRKMSHNQRTHKNHYFSKDMTVEDATYLSWWHRLGMRFEHTVDEDTGCRDISDYELLKSLRSLLGDPLATWKSAEQLDACRLSANGRSQHAVVNTACGGGKSMVWKVAVHARRMFTRILGCTIVICPQTMLLHQHVAKAQDMLRTSGILVAGYTKGDFDDGVPDGLLRCVEEKGLVFLTLDALSAIVDRHKHLMDRWTERKEVERVIVDEFHLLYDEFGIRAYEYLQLRELVTLQAPVLVLSATLPAKLRASAEKFLCLDGSVSQIGGGAYSAPDVAISVTNTTQDAVVEDVCDKAEAKLKEDPGRAVHVIALFRSTGGTIASMLARRGIKCELVTSETAEREKARIAKAWCEGELKLLVSTTGCGLDSPSCGCVIAAVGAWSLMALVQYLGRVREANRGENASMDVLFVSDLGEELWEKFQTNADLCAARMKENNLVASKCDYLEVCTPMAMKEWVETKECRMVAALSKFGGSETKCQRCDNCLRASLFLSKSLERTVNMNRAEAFHLEARSILAALRSNCLVCRDPACDGQGIGEYTSYVQGGTKLCNKGCFRCGRAGDWNHKSSTCAAKAITYADGVHHCFLCLGPWKDTGGYKEHGKGKCKLNHRLRGLYIWCYRNECRRKGNSMADDTEGFKKFMVRHFSDPHEWYRKLVVMCQENDLR